MPPPVAVRGLSGLLVPAPLAGAAAGTSAIWFNTRDVAKAPAASLDTAATPNEAEAHTQHDQEKDQKAEQDLNHH